MEKGNSDSINKCYEALLDIKCIFPSWSDLQNNLFFHWRQILSSSNEFEESENNVLKTYMSMLEPILNYKEGGVESKTALEVVRTLDNYRKKVDEEFETYVLEEVLNKDAPSIVPPRRAAKTPVVRKKPQPAPKIVLNEESTPLHGYGTRRSKMSAEGTFGMGEHLKKGIFSDYVWEFTGSDLKDEDEE
ncbi:hypothetical protein MACK_004091 [Theileria orientalis]|uniref:Uncharacterized protein n=1 Tax=Theileria orientalis TaxID=68886 RepID=A0A976SJW8_THEOR|nr:hypothetical protein MACK_004091 [Theileria orientalis]